MVEGRKWTRFTHTLHSRHSWNSLARLCGYLLSWDVRWCRVTWCILTRAPPCGFLNQLSIRPTQYYPTFQRPVDLSSISALLPHHIPFQVLGPCNTIPSPNAFLGELALSPARIPALDYIVFLLGEILLLLGKCLLFD